MTYTRAKTRTETYRTREVLTNHVDGLRHSDYRNSAHRRQHTPNEAFNRNSRTIKIPGIPCLFQGSNLLVVMSQIISNILMPCKQQGTADKELRTRAFRYRFCFGYQVTEIMRALSEKQLTAYSWQPSRTCKHRANA